MHDESYCTVAECEAPTRQGRARCEFHEKRHQRGQSLTAPKAERLSPKQRLLEAALQVAEADAEDDDEYQRAERNLLHAARQCAPAAMGESIRQGMAEARKRGVRLGRPPAVSPEQAVAMVKRLGTVTLAAKALGVTRDTVYGALARVEEGGISMHDSRGTTRRAMMASSTRAA